MRKAQKKADTQLNVLNEMIKCKIIQSSYIIINLINILIAFAVVRFLEMISIQVEQFHEEEWVSMHLPRDYSWVLYLLGFLSLLAILLTTIKLPQISAIYLMIPYCILLLLIVFFWVFSLDWIKLSFFI